MPSKAQIEQAIRNHFEAWNSKDKARWLANFAEDVRLEDPVGGLPKIGRDGFEKSWLNSFKDGHDWKIEVVLMQVCADQAALHVKNHGKVDNNPVEVVSNVRKRAAKVRQHGSSCVRGEWETETEFNPWAPACTVVSF